MNPVNPKFSHFPDPGRHLLRFRGDRQRFRLTLPEPSPGCAFLRTNIGRGSIRLAEIVTAVEQNQPPLNRDWHDVAMRAVHPGVFEVNLALVEVGHFEGKCYFLPQGATHPVWPSGPNVTINVTAAENCCSNVIYNAFVRQFGPNKQGSGSESEMEKKLGPLDAAGYTVIPPSGTFRDLIAELDFIVGRLGCRILQLLPIHPTPTTYARMGRFGSPYAALSFTDVDPALAEFDPRATPMEQFLELVDAVHRRNARLFLDIAINHTGWAARLHESHPQWLMRDPEGRIEVPGAWGVQWADLTRLDYSHKDLWQYMAEVFLTWCRRGIDGFRCDAGYMIPAGAWTYIVAKVRCEYPDTVFLLEGLGGPMATTRHLLDAANMDCAYSELFQNYDRGQIEGYLPEPLEISTSDGMMVHFAETHDNNRLAAQSHRWSRMRTGLCALLARHGSWGFANGVEWLAQEKIDVHNAASLNWNAAENLVGWIQRLAVLLRSHPAFMDGARLEMGQQGDGNFLVLRRTPKGSDAALHIVINLDPQQPVRARWTAAGESRNASWDLLSGDRIDLETLPDNGRAVELQPAAVLCLSNDKNDLIRVASSLDDLTALPDRVITQFRRARMLDVNRIYAPMGAVPDLDLDRAADRFDRDPIEFLSQINPHGEDPRTVIWQWPQDQRREVMVPPAHLVLIRSGRPLRARLRHGRRTLAQTTSFKIGDGTHAALILPQPTPAAAARKQLQVSVFEDVETVHGHSQLLYLSSPKAAATRRHWVNRRLANLPDMLLGTNGRGAMMRLPIDWGKIKSRYDALLAANLSPEYPEDRWVLFTRCRAWIVYQGYSQRLGSDFLLTFGHDYRGGGYWRFRIPTGRGEFIRLNVHARLIPGENTVHLDFQRPAGRKRPHYLGDGHAVQLILRPDIESRNFHDTTKAYSGPEHSWPAALKALPQGFRFHPQPGPMLVVNTDNGRFLPEPEWQYMVHRPLEAERGLDSDSDLYSPGYFETKLTGGDVTTITAAVATDGSAAAPQNAPTDSPAAETMRPARIPLSLDTALVRALESFVVKRGSYKSIIAGYPWFLDWGRDALIVVRGLIAGGLHDTAREVLLQFGRFERDGTLPNMIRGQEAGDRQTSDAPLWFFKACDDLIAAEGTTDFLTCDCGGRSVLDVLRSIAGSLVAGAPNGVKMDPDCGLIFSPLHFTWMDTNHPAGTPREGYPVEIQALWYAALSLLAAQDQQDGTGSWQTLAQQVETAIIYLFFNPRWGYLSDCLHATAGQSAKQAEADDALRPNQLFAITMGAVKTPAICRQVVNSCSQLVVPGAIRSLADKPLRRPLAVVHQGELLNDPQRPYQGRYQGDEDTRRKPAYHNGTAWTWVFPSFCEAWVAAYGNSALETARAWLSSSIGLLERGCAGHLPEIVDGDFPHTPRGCDAQAWGVSELLRVWHKLSAD